jgi:hypothetical protein
VGRPIAIPRPVAFALLYLGAAALSALTILDGIQPNDEGLMLQAVARIADGQVPYDDFWWYYPPGQPYLLAGLWELFGPSLLAWRVVRVLADAAVAVLAYELARRRAPWPLAIAAWLGAAGAMAFPTGPHPFPIALALALGALAAFERRPLAAGALAGLCAGWRLEFAAYVVVGVAVALIARGGDRRSRLQPLGRFAAATAVTLVTLYTPVVAAAGIGDSWELLVRYPVFDFADYQTLPFPIDYDGPLNTSSPWGFVSDSSEEILHFYLPLALVIGLGGGFLALPPRFRRDEALPIALAIFSLGMLSYLLVRPDLFHTAPLAVVVCVLGAWALVGARLGRLGLVAAVPAALGLVWAVAEGVDRRIRGLEEDTIALDLPVADGVGARPNRARPLDRAVRLVRDTVPPDRPIYVATLRSDLVTSGHPLFYILAERENPTRYDIQAPGVVTSAPVQREIAAALERAQVPVVVRWEAPVTAQPEPNRAGESTGVRIVDDYLTRRYRRFAKVGYYVLLERRP